MSPEPAHHLPLGERRDTPRDPGRERAERAPVVAAAGVVQRRDGGVDAVEQGAEVGGEGVEPLCEQLVGGAPDVDAGAGEARHHLVRLRHCALVDAARGVPVVGEREERGLRHRVDGVGGDQLVDVEHIGIGRVLRACRGPERALHARPGGGEPLPARSAEVRQEALVGDAGVRDGGAPGELRSPGEPAVHLAVDPRDEEGGDRGEVAERQPLLESVLEPLDVGLGDALVDADAKEERDVDAGALRRELAQRLDARGGAGHLDHHVGAPDGLAQPVCLAHGRLGVVLDAGRRLEGDVAVGALRLLVDGAEDVGGAAQVVAGDAHEGVVAAPGALGGGVAKRVVVVGRARDRAVEDRRIGGEAGDPALAHVALELARFEHPAVDEVEPDALSALAQPPDRLRHSVSRLAPGGSRPGIYLVAAASRSNTWGHSAQYSITSMCSPGVPSECQVSMRSIPYISMMTCFENLRETWKPLMGFGPGCSNSLPESLLASLTATLALAVRRFDRGSGNVGMGYAVFPVGPAWVGKRSWRSELRTSSSCAIR